MRVAPSAQLNPLTAIAVQRGLRLDEWPFMHFSDPTLFRLGADWWQSRGLVAYHYQATGKAVPSGEHSSAKVARNWARWCLILMQSSHLATLEAARLAKRQVTAAAAAAAAAAATTAANTTAAHTSATTPTAHTSATTPATTTVATTTTAAAVAAAMSTTAHLVPALASFVDVAVRGGVARGELDEGDVALLRWFAVAFEDDTGATMDEVHPSENEQLDSLLGGDYIVR